MNQQNINKAWGSASRVVAKKIAATLEGVEREISRRAYRASNELRNASLFVLGGTRSGRIYKMPETHGKPTKETRAMMKDYGHKLRGGQLYRASAPGEPPAARTGNFRTSWGTHISVEKKDNRFHAVSSIESNFRAGKYLLGDLLEDGTPRMKPRPYKQQIINRAMPKISELYNKPYNI